MHPAFQGNHEYYYEEVDGDRNYEPVWHIQFANIVWKEDSTGIRIVKDRLGDCISRLETEDEQKEFMWIKLKSHKL